MNPGLIEACGQDIDADRFRIGLAPTSKRGSCFDTGGSVSRDSHIVSDLPPLNWWAIGVSIP